MRKSDRDPWYVIVCRIIMFLVFWLLCSFVIFLAPFACNMLFARVDGLDPFILNFFLDHQWLFYVWGLSSAGLAFYNIVCSVDRAFR